MAEAGHKFVFIAGLHRSGTSLLHRCLQDHPAVSGFSGTGVPKDEGQFLQRVYPTALPYGGPGRFGFDPRSYLDEGSPLATAENARKVFDAWSRHWDVTKPVLIEKSPPNLVRTRFLQALFPEAYFIALLRHPVPVSYATQREWTRRPLYYLIRHWIVCHRRFAADRPHLKRVIAIRYEDFARAPERELGRIWDFLGLEPAPLKREVRAAVNARYFEKWQRLAAGGWPRSAYARWIDKRLGADVRELGYTLTVDE